MAVFVSLTLMSVVSNLFSTSLVASFFDFLLVDVDELILAGIMLLLSLVLTLFLTKRWINSAKNANLVGKDMNKPNYPMIPRSGGLIVAIVICFSLLTYIFLKTFSLLGLPSSNCNLRYSLACWIYRIHRRCFRMERWIKSAPEGFVNNSYSSSFNCD